VIQNVVQDNYYTYKVQTEKAYELLALLNGNGKGHIQAYDDIVGKDSLLRKDRNSNFPNENTICDENDLSPESKSAWNDFWKSEKDKVVKWQLPVQQIIEEGVDHYFVQFPDDLLDAANLKEGDKVEWVDKGDGSYLLKKITQPLGMDEC